MDPEGSDPIFIMKSVKPVHSLQVLRGAFDKHLLVGTEDGTVSFWDLRTRRLTNVQSLNTGSSACVGIFCANGCLVTQDRMGLVKVWSEYESKWTEKFLINLSYCGLCKIDVSNEFGGIIACPQNHSVVEVYCANSGKIETSFVPSVTESQKLGDIMVCKLIHILGNISILAAYESGMVLLWDYKSKNIISKQMFRSAPISLDYDEVRCMGICGCAPNKLQVFRLDSEQNLSIVHNIKLPNKGVGCIKILPEKNLVVVGGWDGRLRNFSWNPFHPLTVLSVHSKAIEDVCFLEERTSSQSVEYIMAAGSSDCRISLWDCKSFSNK